MFPKRTTAAFEALLCLAAAGLCFAPLFNLLGFEFSFALSPLASIAAAHVGIETALRPRARNARGVLGAFGGSAAAAVLMLLPPLAIILANSLRVRNCNHLAGIETFVFYPVSSAVYSASLGAAAGLWLRGRLPSYGAFYAIFAASIGLTLFGLFRGPQVFAYNQFFGFFPGSVYDEVVRIGRPFALFRLCGLAAVAGLAAAEVWLAGRGPRSALCSVLLLGGSLLMQANGCGLGFSSSRACVLSTLRGMIETEHFVIHFNPSGPAAKQIDRLASDHEFRYGQASRFLGVEASAKIHSYVFSGAGEKQRLMGASGTEIAKPWLNEIYLNFSGFPMQSLRHELAHALSASFASPPLRLSGGPTRLNVALTEGLAVAADWPVEVLDPHGYAAALEQLGMQTDVPAMFTPSGFWTRPQLRAYRIAGSFCRFLIETHGIEKFKNAYRSGDLAGAFGKPAADLTAEWRAFLGKLSLDRESLEAVAAKLRRKGIFERRCARELASLTAEAGRALSSKDYRRAASLYERLILLEPENPDNHMGLFEALSGAKKSEEARKAAEKLFGMDASPDALSTIREKLGDLLWESGSVAEAVKEYRVGLRAAFSYERRRMLSVKIEAAGQAAASATLRDFLLGRIEQPLALLKLREVMDSRPGYATAGYLLGRQLFNMGRWKDALGYLNATRSGECAEGALPEILAAENERLAAMCLFHMGRYAEAARAFRLAAEDALPFLRSEILDWSERSEWMDGREPTSP